MAVGIQSVSLRIFRSVTCLFLLGALVLGAGTSGASSLNPFSDSAVSIGSVHGKAGETVAVPLTVQQFSQPITRYSFVLHYNKNQLTFQGMMAAGAPLLLTAEVAIHDENNNTIIAGAVLDSFSDLTDGLLCTLVFRVNAPASGTVPLSFLSVGGSLAGAEMKNGAVTVDAVPPLSDADPDQGQQADSHQETDRDSQTQSNSETERNAQAHVHPDPDPNTHPHPDGDSDDHAHADCNTDSPAAAGGQVDCQLSGNDRRQRARV